MTSPASRFATSGSKLGSAAAMARRKRRVIMRNWNRPPIIAVLLAVLSLAALAGCTQREEPTMMSPGGAQLSEAVAPYTLAFISRNFDSENNTTTFTYQLQNTA